MGVQLVRNGELRKPDDFTDNLSSAQVAGVEASAVDMTDFWKGVLSQIKRLIYADNAGNWHDNPGDLSGKDGSLATLVARATLEGKLGDRWELQLSDATPPAAAYADEVLVCTAQVGNTETVEIGGKTYTFQTTLTDSDGNVQIGVDLEASLTNLKNAINLTGTPGTDYALSTTIHPTVSASNDATTLTATAKKAGTAGNSISLAEGLANGQWTGAATELSGGAGDVVALTGAYKPGQDIAIATTAEGAVCAQLAGAIGAADLAEISGSNALRPESLVSIFDGDTGDAITDGDSRRIYGLLQVGSAATDGNPFGDAGNDQGQITFVVANSTYDDLEIADGANIGGVNLVYAYTRRRNLADTAAVSFRGDIEVADPQAGVLVSLDSAYDGGNFINADGDNIDFRLSDTVEFIVRISGGNPLLRVVRDDGGTHLLQISSTVELFDVDAADSNFAQGVSVDTADQTINLGKTAVGVIDSTAIELRATTGNAKLAAPSGEVQFTSSRDTNLELDDAVAGAISALDGGPHASISAAIKYAMTVGGVDLTADQWDSAATYTSGTNIPGVTLDLTAYATDWNDLPGTVPELFLFLNGRLLRGGNATVGQENDWIPGTTPASGDIKVQLAQPILPNDVILTIGLKA
jgi:hypothetical protein